MLFKDMGFGHRPTQAVQRQIIRTVSVFLNIMAAYYYNFKFLLSNSKKA